MLHTSKPLSVKLFHGRRLLSTLMAMTAWIVAQENKIHIVKTDHYQDDEGYHYQVHYIKVEPIEKVKRITNGKAHIFAAAFGLRFAMRMTGLLLALNELHLRYLL